ncbi:hypothetical protein [Streptomyces atratus]|uniref:hypothetical protein n=1 Tax=Streptomyces atratus TaxID=1893 RepID=UPI0036538D36
MAEEIRILRCDQCKTLEEIPDYTGDPNQDHLLQALIARKHTAESGVTHVGQLMKVEKKHWESPTTRKEILRQLGKETTGLDPEAYLADAAFRAEAMECWKKHLRVAECSDYKTAERRLTPNTTKERKEAGLPKYRSERDVYLCDFCPAKTAAQEQHFTKLGLYK